jgi:RimJ/RimL family protein N-acetyltransferase
MIARALTAADAMAFREIRLDCLRRHPGAFGSTLADWQDKTEDDYVARIEAGVIFGLFVDGGLQGLLAYDRERGGNARHRAGIHAVYIRADHRGQGGIDLLLQAAVGQARSDGVLQLELTVAADNAPAIRAYERAGFVRVGVLPRALRVGQAFVDEVYLILRLDS